MYHTNILTLKRKCEMFKKAALKVFCFGWSDSCTTVLAKQQKHNDYNQPDGFQAMFGCNWEGREKHISYLKFIFHVFINLKLHKAVKQLERFMFQVFQISLMFMQSKRHIWSNPLFETLHYKS